MKKGKKKKRNLKCSRCLFILTSKTAKKGDICPWCGIGKLI